MNVQPQTTPGLRLELLEKLPRVTLLHQLGPDGSLWGTAGRTILLRQAGVWRPIARFPFAAPRDLFSFSRPTVRASRADKSNLFVNSLGGLLGIRAARVYSFRAGHGLRPLFRISGDSALHGGLCEDTQGWTYLGEYFLNPQRQPVRIWRVDPELESREVAYEFPAESVRHVHGVYRDPFEAEALWVTTGDAQGECHLYRTTDRFRSLDRFGDGGQMWRAVRPFFTPDHIAWLTDSQLEQNFACRLRRVDGSLEVGQPIEAPTWYGTQTSDGLFVAFTTVETGPAVQRKEALILVSQDAFHWQTVHAFHKDPWRPMRLFKNGVISCPSGAMHSQDLYLSGEGLVGLDGICLRARIVRHAP